MGHISEIAKMPKKEADLTEVKSADLVNKPKSLKG